MLKLTKKADYGLIALRHLAVARPRASASAKDIADSYRIPLPLLSKVLQKLARGGLLISTTPRHDRFPMTAFDNDIRPMGRNARARSAGAMVGCDIHQKAGIEALLVVAGGAATSNGLNDGMVGDACRKTGLFS